MAKKIKMLKPGKFRAMNGKVVEFTESDLKATAAAYNPALHAAPFVLGHPKHDDPAFGKVGAVDFADGFLMGTPDQVDPAFAEAVNAGKFDRVSLSLYEPDSPSNPVPGVYYPRHLGFLGATPPAVKGLGTVSFAEGEEGVVEFGDYADQVEVGFWRRLKNYLIGKEGEQKAEEMFPEYELSVLTQDALAPEESDTAMAGDMSTINSFSEQQRGGAMALTAAQLATKETELRQREAALKTQENSKTHAGNLEFAEGLVKEGKLLPANKGAVVAVLDFASGITEGDTIEFGEGDAKTTEAPLATLKTLFGAMPKVIEFSELGGGEGPGTQKKAIPADIAKYV